MTWWAAGASVASSWLQGESNRNAQNDLNKSSASAIGEQRRQYDLTREDAAPYRQAGVNALGQLQTEINTPTTAADVMSDPGYKFGLDQGQLALDRKTAAGGGRVSGAALKAASQYGTDYASTGYGAAYQRRQDRLNRLAALAGIGQTSNNSSAVAGTAAANAISGITQQAGNNAGAATLAQGNIWGNAINQLGAIGSRWANTPGTGTAAGNGYTNSSTAMNATSDFG